MNLRGAKNRQKRREAAEKRAGQGTPDAEGQIKALDARLGVGVGAAKERAALAKRVGK